MTTFLDRPPTMTTDYDDTPTIPFEIPSVAETTDGCTAGQRLNTAIKALVEGAKEAQLPCQDGSFLIGDLRREHIAVSQETRTTDDGRIIKDSQLWVATAPTEKHHFYYNCSEISNGDETVIDFRIHEQNFDVTQSAGFIGVAGTGSTHLSSEAAELSTQIAETLLEVVSAQNQEGDLSDKMLHDIAVPLTTPEKTKHQTMDRWLGHTAIGRLLSRFGSRHAAA